MINNKIIEQEFSHINKVNFFNVAHVTIPPKCAKEAYFKFYNECEKNYTTNLDSKPRAFNIVNNAKENISKLINADPSEIAFVKNTTEGIGIIANGYPLESGDNVILSDQEHPANLFAWINLQKKGIELRVVSSRNEEILIEDILQKIDKKTKIITVSAVQFSTGYLIDFEELGRICKKKNIILVVDGIQAIGRLFIDVKKYNINYLSCGGHKGLLAPLGIGFIFCDRRIVHQITPPYVNTQSVKKELPALTASRISEDFLKIEFLDDSRRFEGGNQNYAGIAALKASVGLINKLSIIKIEKHILDLEDELIEGIKKLRFNFRSPLERKNRSGILCVYIPENKQENIKEIFRKNKIYLTIREGFIRISIDFYNTKKQIITLIEAFKEISKMVN